MISQEAEDQVLLDGLSFVSEWPTALAESLLADPTPWWGSWPGDPTDEPNRGPDFARLINCVYGYCRNAHMSDLKLFYGEPSDFSARCFTCPTQKILDALYFMFCRERFGYGQIRRHEKLMRQALQEVVRRVHSEHPPQFLAVTRLTYSLMYADTRLGVLMPYASPHGYLSCHFVADPTFTAIQPLFEEAYQVRTNRGDWEKAYEKVAALGLFFLREDGKKAEVNELRIHDGEASFCLYHRRVL